MMLSRVLSRVSGSLRASTTLLSSSQKHELPILSKRLHTIVFQSSNKLVTDRIPLLQHHPTFNSLYLQQYGMSSSASPEREEKEEGTTSENGASANAECTKASVDAETSQDGEKKILNQTDKSGADSEPASSESAKRRRRGTKRVAFSDSDSEDKDDLSTQDLAKLVAEKEELLKVKHKEIEKMQDKVLRTYAEMENVMDRTRREAENSKKYAIQNFAKSLLDVADNLGRASSVVRDSFSKLDASKEAGGAAPLLKTLLEGVDMTEKQLAEVFKKFGVEKYDPTNEPFDPNRHNAVFQMPDGSKPPGTVAAVLKAGYMLHDRVLRPAEVGVTQEPEGGASENEANNGGSGA